MVKILMILSICKYVPVILALAHLETEKYYKISKALHQTKI